jgi:hypothetical protein
MPTEDLLQPVQQPSEADEDESHGGEAVPVQDNNGPNHFLDTEEAASVAQVETVDQHMWVCDSCHAIFSSKKILNRHKVKHTGVKLACSFCAKRFSRKDALKVHRQKKHPGADI